MHNEFLANFIDTSLSTFILDTLYINNEYNRFIGHLMDTTISKVINTNLLSPLFPTRSSIVQCQNKSSLLLLLERK